MRLLAILLVLACGGGASSATDAGQQDDAWETINKQCKKWELASWRGPDGKLTGFTYCTRF